MEDGFGYVDGSEFHCFDFDLYFKPNYCVMAFLASVCDIQCGCCRWFDLVGHAGISSLVQLMVA